MGTCSTCSNECAFADKYCSNCHTYLSPKCSNGTDSPRLQPMRTPTTPIEPFSIGAQRGQDDKNAVFKLSERTANNPSVSKRVATITDVVFHTCYHVECGCALSKAQTMLQWQDMQNCICYASTIATAIHATEQRMVGRKPVTHSKLLNKIKLKYGADGANVVLYDVLKQECSKRRLICTKVDECKAKEAIFKNRVIVATLELDKEQCRRFALYFKGIKAGILTKAILGSRAGETQLYSVCIMGFNYEHNYWRMQSAEHCASQYFCVALGAIARMSFYDILSDHRNVERSIKNNVKN